MREPQPAPWRRLARTSPELAGVSRQAIDALISRLDALGGVHSMMLMRAGAVVAEASWAPYSPQEPHKLFSVSKTFTAMAVGIAVEEGLLTVDDRVIDLLPDSAPNEPCDNLRAMRVWNLLTMTTGHATGPMQSTATDLGLPGSHWARDILAQPVPLEPGSRFVYNTAATYLLSAIIHRLTGQRLLDYLTPRLLAPLGITGASWEQDPAGIDVGGYGLSVLPEDLAAFGQLLLQRGRWQGRQLVPAQWIDTAMSHLVDTAVQGWEADWSRGYGYQMWQCPGGFARADGAFGQFIIVWPQHQAVLVLTSGLGGAGPAGTQVELNAVWESLAQAFDPLTAPDVTSVSEPDAVRCLSLPLPQGQASSPLEAAITAVPFQLDGGLVQVTRRGDLLEVRTPGWTVTAAHGRWQPGSQLANPEGRQSWQASAAYAWTDSRTLQVTAYATTTPFGYSLTLHWPQESTDRVDVSLDLNVSFDSTQVMRGSASRIGQ